MDRYYIFLYLTLSYSKQSTEIQPIKTNYNSKIYIGQISGLKAVLFQICYPFLDYFIVLLQ